jgi:hypothetical protein
MNSIDMGHCGLPRYLDLWIACKDYCGGLQTLQGVYPFDFASANVVLMWLCDRYRHPARWYLFPVRVMYTVVVFGSWFCCRGAGWAVTVPSGTRNKSGKKSARIKRKRFIVETPF